MTSQKVFYYFDSLPFREWVLVIDLIPKLVTMLPLPDFFRSSGVCSLNIKHISKVDRNYISFFEKLIKRFKKKETVIICRIFKFSRSWKLFMVKTIDSDFYILKDQRKVIRKTQALLISIHLYPEVWKPALAMVWADAKVLMEMYSQRQLVRQMYYSIYESPVF